MINIWVKIMNNLNSLNYSRAEVADSVRPTRSEVN